MSLGDLSRSAVLAAIQEFDELGRDEFLAKYGFGRAQTYFVVVDGKRYDSKAIAGAAHGFLTGREALRPSDFSGGDATVARQLRALGFEVSNGITSADEDGRRPPTWVWDELVLACDLTASNGWHELDVNDPRVVELSELLRRLPIHPEHLRGGNFRSVGSVRRKMTNLAHCHPDSSRKSSNGSVLDRAVVEAFLDRPEQMHERAVELRSGRAGAGGEFAQFKPKSDAAYVAAVRAQVQAKQRPHETLVRDYGSAIGACGFTAATNVHPRDLTLTRGGRHWLVEVKVVYGGNATEAVRATIGQLQQYRYFLYARDADVELVAVFNEPIGDAFVGLLESLGIRAIWRHGAVWCGSPSAMGDGLIPSA
ncbi:hypothetical protein NDR87_16415 [Nocardia sp. CDC159]|uniref:ScoMcrA-like N-terminal head domain-containing protein n=1 Tax=Nocardia pulmonis TaxID=2951408 RepID=A0A9X2E731_9NOCA|nr:MULTISPECIES: hypothetical protein [Nocardia]MCM6775322.1 hypothetical protein [Nocardia pulmonis]MCM6787944.1 hypothetical protein [Nocardia sp. CDC159]